MIKEKAGQVGNFVCFNSAACSAVKIKKGVQMHTKGKKTRVGEEIIRYIKSRRKTVDTISLEWGIPATKISRVIYGSCNTIRPELAEKFKKLGFDLSEEFRIAAKKTPTRVVFFKDSVDPETYDKILVLLGRKV